MYVDPPVLPPFHLFTPITKMWTKVGFLEMAGLYIPTPTSSMQVPLLARDGLDDVDKLGLQGETG